MVIVIIVSWFLYRCVAPQSWREWTRAGLIQAFIIALYAEMYGLQVWDFLKPYVAAYDAAVFTLAEFCPPDLDGPRIVFIPPAKNNAEILI